MLVLLASSRIALDFITRIHQDARFSECQNFIPKAEKLFLYKLILKPCICKGLRCQASRAAVNILSFNLLYCRDQCDDGYILAEICSWLHLINKSSV